MPKETISNYGASTLAGAITTTPAPGTTETWNIVSTASFAQTTGQSRFVVTANADGTGAVEIVLGTTPPATGSTMVVTRGAESTTPIAHQSGSPITEVITAGSFATLEQTINKGVASGYAPLDSNALVPAVNLPAAFQPLVPTNIKTSAYTAVVGDFVPVDITSGGVTITLPTAPAAGSRIGVMCVNTAGSNAVTVAAGGADVFEKSGGATTETLVLLGQTQIYQYLSGVWYITTGALLLASLDGRYLSFGGGILTGSLTVQSDVDISVAGHGLKVAEGSNAKQGTATLAAGTVTVANTSVTASSRIFLTVQSVGGDLGMPYISARTAGTSFTITSTSSTDTSTVAYEIFEPG